MLAGFAVKPIMFVDREKELAAIQQSLTILKLK
jgi:hypothetical protein